MDDDKEFAKLVASAEPKSLGRVSKEQLFSTKEKAKAVLFLPDGSDLSDALDIEVVGLNAATMAAMAARRC